MTNIHKISEQDIIADLLEENKRLTVIEIAALAVYRELDGLGYDSVYDLFEALAATDTDKNST